MSGLSRSDISLLKDTKAGATAAATGILVLSFGIN